MIGGTGLIGPHAVKGLMAAGAEVTTLTRSGRAMFCERALRGDRNRRIDLLRALDEVQPDMMIDMIPFTTEEAQLVHDVIASSGLPLLALSSGDVYRAYGMLHSTEDGTFQTCPVKEDAGLRTELGPEGAAYDKIGVEKIYKQLLNVTIIRMPIIYGWPDTTRIEKYLDQMLEGAQEISISADRAAFRMSRSLHRNAAHAIVCAAVKMGGQRVYNLSEPKSMTEADWIKRIAEECGWPGKIDITQWKDDVPSPRQQLYMNSNALRRETGFTEVHDIDAGFSEMVQFYAYEKLGKPYRKFY